MKHTYFVTLLSCLLAAYLCADDINKKKLQILDECQSQAKLSKEEYDNIVVKKLEPSAKNGFCFVACFYSKMEFLAANNSIQVDMIKKEVDRLNPGKGDEYERKIKVVENCKKKEVVPVPADVCDAAANLKKCIFNEKKAQNVNSRMW